MNVYTIISTGHAKMSVVRQKSI